MGTILEQANGWDEAIQAVTQAFPAFAPMEFPPLCTDDWKRALTLQENEPWEVQMVGPCKSF